MRPVSCLTLAVFWVLVCACRLSAADSADEVPPNFLLIVTDDQGWWDLGSHGNPVLDTPVLDRLAGESVEFTRFYVQPVCAPTRAGLLTGRYYLRTGLYNTRFGGDSLGKGEITLADLLARGGYRSGLFGKWHLGVYAPWHPQSRGFDEFFGLLHGHIEHYDYPTQLWQGREPVAARGYITELLTDAAIHFVRTERQRPFFCYLAYNVPHSPYIVGNAHGTDAEGEALVAKYVARGTPLREARIYAMIERCDAQVGRLLAALDELELAARTVVLFMSDNGGVHSHYRAGLRGGKGSTYEGGVLSPLLVRWPGRFAAGSKVDAAVSHVDLLPTLCELAGVDVPSDRPIDGKSIVGLLTEGGGPSPHSYVYHIWDRYRPSLESRWAVADDRYKLVHEPSRGLQLFDLSVDRGEARDLARQLPQQASLLEAEFRRWFTEVTAGQSYLPAPIPVGHAQDNAVEVQASWARVIGDNARYEFRAYDWDTIEGWTTPGDAAVWRIEVERPGCYEVSASYGADRTRSGGTFRVAVGSSNVEATVEPTADRNVFIRRVLGTIELEAGPAELRVEAVRVPSGELMTLNRLWLRRID